MRKLIIALLKPLSFLPAICVMCLIYSFSAQTGVDSGSLSHKISYMIADYGSDLLQKDYTEEQLQYYADRLEYPVRKLAHMTEYFVLAVCISFPLYVYGMRGFLLMFVAGIICVGFAAGDEYHQSFVAGRGPSKRDVVIDSIGAFGGIIVVRIVCWIMLTPARIMARLKERERRKQALIENRRRVEARRHEEARRNHRPYHPSPVTRFATTMFLPDSEDIYQELTFTQEQERHLAEEIKKYMDS